MSHCLCWGQDRLVGIHISITGIDADQIRVQTGALDSFVIVAETKACGFIMPLDPYLSAHTWGMYVSDCAVHNSSAIPFADGPTTSALHISSSVASSAGSSNPSAQHSNSSAASFADGYSSSAYHAVETGPPKPELTPEQLYRNRNLALLRKQAKRLREVQQLPLTYIQVSQDSQGEAETWAPSVVPLRSATSGRRNRFAFGSVSAVAARRQTALDTSTVGSSGSLFVKAFHMAQERPV